MGRLRQPGRPRSNRKVPKSKTTKKPLSNSKSKRTTIVSAADKKFKKVTEDETKLARKFHAAKRDYLGPLLMRMLFRSNHAMVADHRGEGPDHQAENTD